MGLSSSLKKRLQELLSLPVQWDTPLSARTTLRIGGPAEALVIVNDNEELQSVIALCKDNEVDWKLLGKGSNILVSDEGYQGIIMVLGSGFKFIEKENNVPADQVLVRVGAATSLSRIGDWAAVQGLSGFEFAAGIPGTVGGALAMNAGAWGEEIGRLINRVELVGSSGRLTRSSQELHFSYRRWDDLYNSLADHVIVSAAIELTVSKTAMIQQKMSEFRRMRKERQPVGVASAGSFFKNPDGRSAGQLIDAAGLKGLRVGDAEVSEKHANFLVNRGQATAGEMLELMCLIQEKVQRDSNVLLEPEVLFL